MDDVIDIICVSESWFHPDINDNIYSVGGYNILKANRHSNGGGVVIYIDSKKDMERNP